MGPAMTEPPGEDDLVTLVSDFLRLVEARDLEAAERYLAADATITFPGGRRFTSLTEQVASSAGRFIGVTKTFDRFDLVSGSTTDDPTDDESVVYVFGTLSGQALDGTRFDGIRFIDRFEVQGEKIVMQEVWNDLAVCSTQSN